MYECIRVSDEMMAHVDDILELDWSLNFYLQIIMINDGSVDN